MIPNPREAEKPILPECMARCVLCLPKTAPLSALFLTLPTSHRIEMDAVDKKSVRHNDQLLKGYPLDRAYSRALNEPVHPNPPLIGITLPNQCVSTEAGPTVDHRGGRSWGFLMQIGVYLDFEQSGPASGFNHEVF